MAAPYGGTKAFLQCPPGAGAAPLIFKSEREYQLKLRAIIEMRYRNRQQRDRDLAG
jgi:hypothetical protein